MSNRSVLRIQKELLDIQKDPEHQFHIWYNEENITHVHALIVGPPQTPYCLGYFDFVFNMSDEYPQAPPKVTAMTTALGRTRFNPNIYANGKVCLSILGTWEARKAGEKWSAAHGILSILISIQSLLSDKPYHNEPGQEDEKSVVLIENYNKKIMHETLRVSLCDRMEEYLGWAVPKDSKRDSKPLKRNFCNCRAQSPFIDVSKRMFIMYYDIYMNTVESEKAKVVDGTAFQLARFEMGSNCMDGSYQYTSIKSRLEAIQTALLAESAEWISESPVWLKNETTTASNLRSQFDQIVASKDFDGSILLELEDDNPFCWTVTVIGMPMTQYDGGMFRAQIHFHDDFPEIAPRIRFSCHVFHPQITQDGIPYIRVQKPEDLRQYLEALKRLFWEDPLADPTTHLNPKAAGLYWGDKEARRDYNRSARRCAQRSVEY
ncbi:small conjugating protein ligase-like protein [Phlyctochytrium arcticum]|nr:small conjugating protein ligase-like protein [Phlyctochytrium arcticum]